MNNEMLVTHVNYLNYKHNKEINLKTWIISTAVL